MTTVAQNAAAMQAELMEKQKNVVEHHERVTSMKETVQNLANHEGALLTEKRRCNITNAQLVTLAEGHNVFRAVGRTFVKMPVKDLSDMMTTRETKCGEEAVKLAAEKKRVAEAMVKEEEQLQQAKNDFVATVTLMQAQNAAAANAAPK